MYFSLVLCDDLLYQRAKEFFLQQWRSDLMTREENSLIGAYLVTQYMRKNWKVWFSFSEWKYSYEELFFSTSHSEDLVMVAIDTKKIAVDIEYINTRDESLLQNVHVPNSPHTPRENFYIQRCAKECLIKFLNLNIEEMQEMFVCDFICNYHFWIDERNFDSLFILHYRWKEYPVHINLKNNKVLALLQESSDDIGTLC